MVHVENHNEQSYYNDKFASFTRYTRETKRIPKPQTQVSFLFKKLTEYSTVDTRA